MKPLLIFLFSLSLCCGQNVAVRFYGSNPDGLPANWPVQVQPCGTNTSVAGFSVMTQAELNAIISTNRAAYTAWESNKIFAAQAKLNENMTRLLTLYNQIPKARTWTASTLTTCTNIDASLASGTNSNAQIIARVRQINAEAATQARIQAGILELLQRLGPVLRDMYRADNDDTQ